MARRLGMLRPAAGRRADGERGRAKNTFNSPFSKRVREAPAVPCNRNIRFADRARSASGSAPRRAPARPAGAPRAGRRCSAFLCGAASPVRPFQTRHRVRSDRHSHNLQYHNHGSRSRLPGGSILAITPCRPPSAAPPTQRIYGCRSGASAPAVGEMDDATKEPCTSYASMTTIWAGVPRLSDREHPVRWERLTSHLRQLSTMVAPGSESLSHSLSTRYLC